MGHGGAGIPLAFPSKASCGALFFVAAHACAGPVQSIRIGPIDAAKVAGLAKICRAL